MKKTLLTLAIVTLAHFSYAQTNTFPSSGNAGIGTTSPGAGLDITDVTSGGYNFRVTGGYSNFNTTSIRHTYGSSGHLWDVNYGDITSFSYNDGTTWSTNRITFDNSGNLTTAGNLTISGGSISATNYGGLSYPYNTAFGSGADASYTQLYAGSTGGYTSGLYVYGGGTGTPNIITFKTASTERMRINASGNVGIGTTSPGYKIDAFNSDATPYSATVANATLRVYNPSATDNAFSGVEFAGQNSSSEYGSTRIGSVIKSGYSADFVIQQRNGGTYQENIRVLSNGKVGIGTTIPDEKLSVLGKIHANEVKVDLSVPGPDYVFEPEYKLTGLAELKTYLDKNHHLPEIPSAKQMEKEGISLGDMNMKLLKKVEELHLYLIEKDDQIDKQNEKISSQQKINQSYKTQLQSQQQQIDELKQQLTAITKTLTK